MSSFRRIVTGHDAQGRSVIRSVRNLTPAPAGEDADFALVWATPSVPADNTGEEDGDALEAGKTLRGGSVIRVVDMMPGRQSAMHRSFSLDYGVVISGELELELDGGGVERLGAGDIVVQRGTNHLWRNPSPHTVCRIVFVLIEAAPISIGGRTLDEIHP